MSEHSVEAVGPAVILVGPQMAENVGAAARAMLNCGLTEMRIVAPCFPWPADRATTMAAGADRVLEQARIFATTREAVADLQVVVACSARTRDMNELRQTPRAAVAEMRARVAEGARCAWMFGPERAGLSNDDLVHADRIVTVPLNPGFRSLNLAQAVLLIAYEWFAAGVDAAPEELCLRRDGRLATKGELDGLMDHIVAALGERPFERIPEKRPAMLLHLRNTFSRAGLTEAEVRGLRWVISQLEPDDDSA